MKISSVEYSFIDAFKSLRRNRSLSVASSATVAATLFIFGVFLLVSANLNLVMRGVENQLEVKVSLIKDITLDQQNNIESTLKNTSGVKSVTIETKEQALENFKKQLGDNNKDILAGLDTANNPLPNSYIVKVNKPEIISQVVKNVKGMDGVDEINDGKDVVNTVITVGRTIKIIGAGIFIILMAVSFFLIGNTIKLTVYSRRREIGIMKYIGATDWFIRIPFIIEGIMLGIFGAIISDVLLYYIYKVVFMKAKVAFVYFQLVNPGYVFTNLLWMFLGIGVIIGSAGSVFAVRKFLAV